MTENPFQDRQPNVADNEKLRIPQREAYAALANFYENNDNPEEREVGIVLPVGCGKSGCITLSPFAFKARRALVVAPGIPITKQLQADFDPANPNMFYLKCDVLKGPPYPEPVEIRGTTTNVADLEEAQVVITNIQQLQGENNRWLNQLPADFFDLILFDEGHQTVAASWLMLKDKFNAARIVNYSATPLRADGQIMAGRVLYSYPIYQAIQRGYIKRLKAVVLNPRTLRYVRREDGEEIQVDLDEVKRLGEDDADFRRSIVSSEETLNTIVDASIRQLEALRTSTGENRLKIIASALNYYHCQQVVEAYCARGKRAEYVHSREDSAANARVMQKLDNHEIDVIVQVRKLGQGFDHKYLSVAAVFSIFSNLSPFVQFVGRTLRVIEQNAPTSPLNQGVVVFHAGANIAQRWQDFQEFSEADQEYFDLLLPLEDMNFDDASELEIEPDPSRSRHQSHVEVRGQSEVHLQEIPLLQDNDVQQALRILQEKGLSPDEAKQGLEQLTPIPVTKVRQRQAMRSTLDSRVKTEVGRILGERNINPEGHELDKQHLGKSNFVVLKSTIDRYISTTVDRGTGERSEYTRAELDHINDNFKTIVADVEQEVFGA